VNWYAASTVAERIVGIAIRLRNARVARTGSSVVARENAVFGAVSYILWKTHNVRWVAHLNYSDD